jgi:hypothetical protein
LKLESGENNPFAFIFIAKMIICGIAFIMYGISRDIIEKVMFIGLGMTFFLIAFPYDTFEQLHDIGALLSYSIIIIIMLKLTIERISMKNFDMIRRLIILIILSVIFILNFIGELIGATWFFDYAIIFQVSYIILFFIGIL